MTKREFERELESRLRSLPHEERAKAIDYYDELFFDKLEHGIPEDEIIRGFGSPADIAVRIISETKPEFGYAGQKFDSKDDKADDTYTDEKTNTEDENLFQFAKRKVHKAWNSVVKNRNFQKTYLAFAFITIPLTIAFAITVFGLSIGAIAAIMAFGIAGVACAVAGPVVLVASIVKLAEGSTVAYGLAVVGNSIMVIGAGLFFTWLFVKLSRFFFALVFSKKSMRADAIVKVKNAKTHPRWFMGIIAVIIGISISIAGLGVADWDFRRLDNTNYIPYSLALDDTITEINMDLISRNVEIIKTEDDFKIETNNYDKSMIAAEFELGILTITENLNCNWWEYITFFDFSFFNRDLKIIKIFVPETLDTVDINCTSGNVGIQDITATDINIDVTSGNARLKNCTADAFDISTTSGNIRFENCATDTLRARTTSGNISTVRLAVTDAEFNVTSGNVWAQILGVIDDYDISGTVVSGNKNFSNRTLLGGYKLKLTAISGNLSLYFVV